MAQIMIDRRDKYNECAECDFEGFEIYQVHNLIEITYNDGKNEPDVIAVDANDAFSYFNVKRKGEEFGKMVKGYKKEHNIPEKDISGYIVAEKGTHTGKGDLITDIIGHNYSRWRETEGKNKTISFRCINRGQRKKRDFVDCKCYLSVSNYKEDNMEVAKMDDHNHDPHMEQNIKRDMYNDLKRKWVENPDMKNRDIIEDVIKSNEHYQKLYQTGSPKFKSMCTFLQRHRSKRKSE